MTFRRRLTLVSAIAVAVAIVVASVVVYLVVRDQLRGQADSSLEQFAGGPAMIAAGRDAPAPGTGPRGDLGLPIPPPGRGGGGALLLAPGPLAGPQGFAQVISGTGRVLRSPPEVEPLPVSDQAREVASGGSAPFFQDLEVDGHHVRVLTAPAGPDRAIQVARSLEEVDGTLRTLLIVLGIVSLGGVVAAALLGWAISRTAVAPVARLTEAAEHVARTSDLGSRIEVDGSRDEVARLAGSFNAMLAELERSVTAQRRLVADASHELRTPLTSLRTNIEVLARANGSLDPGERERLLGDVVAQLGELGGLVGNLVDLARDDEPDVGTEDLRLDELVAGAVQRARRNAPGTSFSLDADPCAVRGVADRLERAVGNLLDNAAKWSPPDGEVEVTVRDGAVTVRDHGPGIDAADLPHVFERFYRAPSARGMPGSGLGLAIVSQVIAAHGGSVEAANAAGGGTVVTMRLPAHKPAALAAASS